jgi:hypothetical protein
MNYLVKVRLTNLERYQDGNPTIEHRSESGNLYYLSKNSTAAREAGQLWSCNCMSWIIQKKRPCKHLKKDSRINDVLEDVKYPLDEAPGNINPKTGRAKGYAPNKEKASQEKIAVREKYEAKKVSQRSGMRYGFQLAKHYSNSDFLGAERTVVEVKYDGILGMLVDDKLYNRSGADITNRFPEIEHPSHVVLVGEVVILQENGLSDFHAMQERATDDTMKIRLRASTRPATFMAFDILERDDKDLTEMTFRARRILLEDWYNGTHYKGIELIDQIQIKGPEDIEKLKNKMAELGGEGLMVKDQDAVYRPVRGKSWLKVKTWQEEDYDILRFEDTGVGHGFVIYIKTGAHEQRVVCNDLEMEAKIRAGHKRATIKFLSKGEDGAMRFPSLKRLVNKVGLDLDDERGDQKQVDAAYLEEGLYWRIFHIIDKGDWNIHNPEGQSELSRKIARDLANAVINEYKPKTPTEIKNGN